MSGEEPTVEELLRRIRRYLYFAEESRCDSVALQAGSSEPEEHEELLRLSVERLRALERGKSYAVADLREGETRLTNAREAHQAERDRLRERVAELERENKRLHNSHDELFPYCKKAVDALYAENAQLRADSERLEWLERHRPYVNKRFNSTGIEMISLRWAWNRSSEGTGFREAIDEERNRAQQAQGGGEE